MVCQATAYVWEYALHHNGRLVQREYLYSDTADQAQARCRVKRLLETKYPEIFTDDFKPGVTMLERRPGTCHPSIGSSSA